ncbi:MAG TPA: glycosyl hydrolase-related protein [Spirochaetia bacterium]|nr:glycosyl hydrolase-related protein [Spirochaetia bacterium]
MAAVQKEIHFTMGTHLDLFWMGAPRDCLDRGTEIIVEALELCLKHKEYCYYIESVVFAEHLLKLHPEKKPLMAELIKSGNLEIGGAYADRVEHSHEGESILRHHIYAVEWIQKTFGITPRSSCHSDLPGLSPQVPQILAKCGIRYYIRARGVCAVYTWEAPDGSSILYGNFGSNYGEKTMPEMDEELKDAGGFPPKVIMRGGYGDLQMVNDHILALIQDLKRKYPQYGFQMSSPSDVLDFYRENESARRSLPRIKGEWPYGWGNGGSLLVEDYRLEMALENALLAGEKAVTAARLLGHALRPKTDRAMWWCSLFRYAREGEPPVIEKGAELQEAWKAEMFCQDHNYSGFSGNKSDHDRSVMLKYALAYIGGITDNALSDVCGSIGTPSFPHADRAAARVVVFNPLSWPRDEVVRVTLPGPLVDAPILLVDEKGSAQGFERSKGELSFTAKAVPSVGYRPYFVLTIPENEIHRLEPPSPIHVSQSFDLHDWHREFVRWQNSLPEYREPWLAETPEGDGLRLETAHYRIHLSGKHGYIGGIYSKKLGRELTGDRASRRFAELLSYEDPGIDVRYCFTGSYTRDSQSSFALRKVSSDSVSATFALEGYFNLARVEKRITLYAESPAIDLEVVIYWWNDHGSHVRLCLPFSEKDFRQTWYGVPYYAMQWPLMMEGVADSVILGMEKKPDELRYEDRRHFREVVKWVDVGYADCGVTLAVQLPNMWIDDSLLEVPLIRSNRSCGDHNVWADNSGRQVWKFRLNPHAGDWRSGKAYRTGWDLNNPLAARVTGPSASGALRAEPASFFRVSQDNVVLSVAKPANDGSGDVILRYCEMEGKKGTVEIECLKTPRTAHEADLLERPGAKLTVNGNRILAPTAPYEIKTIRCSI